MMKRSIQSETGNVDFSTENRSFSGYGIVFDSDSVPLTIYDRDLGPVRVIEQITRESVERADKSDVIAAINHNFDKILGRTSAGTLELEIDERGVKYRMNELPNTTYANDLLESAKRGDFRGSSFTFSVNYEDGYEIEERNDGALVAKPRSIEKIYEMGPVTNPAYPDTTAENRSDALFSAVSAYLQRKSEEPKPEESEGITDAQMNDLEKRLRLSEEEAAI